MVMVMGMGTCVVNSCKCEASLSTVTWSGIPGFGGQPWSGFGGRYGFGFGGPSGGYSRGGVVRPSVVCKHKGPCYNKKLTCPAKCFTSYSRSGKGYGAGGGGGGCTMDCEKNCVAYC
ncbi:hypothetical protein MLD38_036999 [Melastoma candidum]|uniref:Uncharacterized protein n=1 Tax=Melastoma candidum TaxID=119954 RepID=A0ACB9LLM1_9MYRT|nr:hypothetical protein MLD38_036999 [Melastoma candidum]